MDESVAQAKQEPIPVSKSAEEVQAEAVKEWDAKPKQHEDEEEGFVRKIKSSIIILVTIFFFKHILSFRYC